MSVTLNTRLEDLMFSSQIPLEPTPSDPQMGNARLFLFT